MSLNDIDDFAVEVTLNADDYNKALEELQAKNKELEQSLGKLESSFEQSGKSTKLSGAEARKSAGEMDKYMLSIRSVALGLASIGGATMAVKGLTDLTASTAKSNREMSINAKTLGMSVNQYRNWGRAITEMGGDADSFSQSMINMRDKITEFQVTGNPEILKVFNATEIAMLKNINTAESMENIFLNISDVIKKISESGGDGYNKSQFLAEQFGIDKTNHAMVLLRGSAEIKRIINLQKSLYQVTEENLKNTAELLETTGKLENRWSSIKDHIGNGLIPVLNEVKKETSEWLKELEESGILDKLAKLALDSTRVAVASTKILSEDEKKRLDAVGGVAKTGSPLLTSLFAGWALSQRAGDNLKNAELPKINSMDMMGLGFDPLGNSNNKKSSVEEEDEEEEKDDFDIAEARRAIYAITDAFENSQFGLRNSLYQALEDGYVGYMEAIEKSNSPTLLTDAIFKGLEKFEQAYGNKSLDGLAKLIDGKQNAFETKLEDKERSAVEGAKMTDYSRAYGVPDNKKDAVGDAMKFFINNGYTSEQAAGIVGNLIAESNLSTSAEGDKGLKGGSSFGIAQWREGRLRQFEKLYGKHVKDASYHEQLQFVLWELQNTHQSANRDILNSTTVEGASSAFTKKFEIPANKDQVALNRHSISRGVLRDHNDRQFQEINNSVQVMVGDVIIQTSSGTMKGAGVELGNSLANTWSNLNQLGASQR